MTLPRLVCTLGPWAQQRSKGYVGHWLWETDVKERPVGHSGHRFLLVSNWKQDLSGELCLFEEKCAHDK